MIKVLELANIEKIFWWVLVPLIVVLIIFYILSFIFNMKYKDDNPNKANYLINYCSGLIGIVFGSIILGLIIGFSIAFVKQLKVYNMVSDYLWAYYFFLIFPVVPFTFLIISIRNFLRNLNRKKLTIKKEEEVRYGEE